MDIGDYVQGAVQVPFGYIRFFLSHFSPLRPFCVASYQPSSKVRAKGVGNVAGVQNTSVGI
jgi:hypothetical protein